MSATTAYSSPPERAPSVLVVLAVRDAAEWLRECLQALAVQTYPRVGVLAVDDAATEGKKVITGMLIVGLIFISVIALGQTLHWLRHRRR